MTKAQREKAERLLLKQMLDSNPKLKEILDEVIKNSNPELKDVIQPIIEEELKKSRTMGINIGFLGATLTTYEKIKNMNTVDEVKECIRTQANEVRERLKLNKVFDENGNLIVEDEE